MAGSNHAAALSSTILYPVLQEKYSGFFVGRIWGQERAGQQDHKKCSLPGHITRYRGEVREAL